MVKDPYTVLAEVGDWSPIYDGLHNIRPSSLLGWSGMTCTVNWAQKGRSWSVAPKYHPHPANGLHPGGGWRSTWCFSAEGDLIVSAGSTHQQSCAARFCPYKVVVPLSDRLSVGLSLLGMNQCRALMKESVSSVLEISGCMDGCSCEAWEKASVSLGLTAGSLHHEYKDFTTWMDQSSLCQHGWMLVHLVSLLRLVSWPSVGFQALPSDYGT